MRLVFRLLAVLIVVPALLAVSGCGGGGGLSFGSLIWVAQWNGIGPGGNDAQSVRVRLLQGGVFVTQGVIPRSGANADTGEFLNLSTGDYEAIAEAYTSSDGTGTPFAYVRTHLSVSGGLPTTYVSSVGTTPTSVQVTPSAAPVNVGGTAQFRATALDVAGVAVFTADSDWQWESLATAVATVDATGLVTGVSEGTATIRATYTPGPLEGTALVTVSSGTQQSKYTILVFLNAANDLDHFSDLNVNQMEFANKNPQVRVVLQWKRIAQFDPPWTGTRRYLVRHDNDPYEVNSVLLDDLGQGVDMGDWQTLHAFIDWGMRNYPADHMVLVMWNHGSGWRGRAPSGGTRGVSFDDETGNHIRTWELSQALDHTPKIDVLAWDASLMQMLEVAYEVKDVVDYVVGSEESPPGEGYPYDIWLTALADNDTMTPQQVTVEIVNAMIQGYGMNSNITQSSIRTAQLPALADALSTLADELTAKKPLYLVELQLARNQAEHYSVYPEYKDLFDVCSKLGQITQDNAIITAAINVQAAVAQAVVAEKHGDQHPNSRGIAIAYPDAANYSSQYGLLKLALFTHWDEWLQIAP